MISTKVMNIIKIIILAILMVIIQLALINQSPLFGVIGSIVLMYVVIISIKTKMNIAIPLAFIMGLVIDVLYTFQIGLNTFIFTAIAIIVVLTSNVYKLDVSTWVIIYAVSTTAIYEIYMACVYSMKYGQTLGIFEFFLTVLKACVVNIALAYILRYVLNKLIKEEDEFGGIV